ncbi:MAG: UvrD-helicase domain-containing protein, partial [Candidatus Margulisbacteria bacterium]|nr:UvrD-helicase domain-containing protein [Candidatus Margulisiibacteriota bacterium]
MLSKLNARQKEAVLCTEGPLMILAGAGSGKTRVLTTRIKYLLAEKQIPPERVLAVTFTNKAAREMEERIGARLPWIGTFHGICGRLLRRHIQLLPGYSANYVIYDDADQTVLIKNILREAGLDKDKQLTPQKVLGQIGWAKNRMFGPAEYARLADDTALRGQPQFRQASAGLYQKYQLALRQNNAVDFDDMLLLTIELFQKNPDLLARYQDQFQYVLVDEYQDTNKAQYTLIHLLAARHQNICVVGDSDQNIYSWRGADITNILSFEQDYPQARVILLEQNYRSTANILNAANAVIKNNEMRKAKNLWTENSEGAKCEFILTGSETDEAQYVAETIAKTRAETGGLNSYAVFYRTNAQSRVFEEALVKRSMPYRLVGGVKFYARKEVKDILAYLRLIANPLDTVSLQRIINLPARGLGAMTVAKYSVYAEQQGLSFFAALGLKIPGLTGRAAQAAGIFQKIIQDLQALAATMSLSELINEVIVRSGYRD